MSSLEEYLQEGLAVIQESVAPTTKTQVGSPEFNYQNGIGNW